VKAIISLESLCTGDGWISGKDGFDVSDQLMRCFCSHDPANPISLPVTDAKIIQLAPAAPYVERCEI
jgi:hypothetical protein